NWSEIDFIPIEDDSASDIALQSGQLDFAQLSLAGIDRFLKNSKVSVTKRVSLNYQWIGMNIRHPKLKDIRVRQAIRRAVGVVSFTCAQLDVWNWMYWCDATFDHLQAQGLKTLSPARRNQIYIQMQKRWDQNANSIWIAWPTYYFGTRKGIQPAVSPHAWTIA